MLFELNLITTPPAAPPPLPIPPAPRPRSATRAHAHAAAPPPAAPLVDTGLDGQEGVEAIRAKLEAGNKMLVVAALDHAHMVLDGTTLVVSFAETAAAHRKTVERARATIETAAHEATGRQVRVTVGTGEAPSAAPPPAAPVVPAARAPRAAPPPESASDPIVQAVLDTFKGQLLGIEPPPDDTQ